MNNPKNTFNNLNKLDISFSQPKNSYYKTRIIDTTTGEPKYESGASSIGFAYNGYSNLVSARRTFPEPNIRIELVNTATGDVVRSTEM